MASTAKKPVPERRSAVATQWPQDRERRRHLMSVVDATQEAASESDPPVQPEVVEHAHPADVVASPPISGPPGGMLSPLDLPTAFFREGLDRRKENRHLLMEWLRTALVEGVDYGRVHLVGKDRCDKARVGRIRECANPAHWSKPSLFKPGAEKITGMLGMTVHYPSLAAYESALISGAEIKNVVLRCELRDGQGRVVAEGVGARSMAEDYGDLNKALKMAEKSAHIDATLRLAGLSEVFTQDMEDRPGQAMPESAQAAQTASADAPRSPSPPRASGESDVERITDEDVQAIRERMAEVGIAEKRVLAWLARVTKGEVTRFEQLNVAQCASLLKRLDRWARDAGDGQA